MNSSLKYLST